MSSAPSSAPAPLVHAPSPEAGAGFEAAGAAWLRRYARSLLVLDATVLALAGPLGVAVRFGSSGGPDLRGMSYLIASLLLAPVGLATLALSRCYEKRFLGSGTEEFKRVANASFRLTAVIAIALLMTKTDVSRGFLAIALSVGLFGVVSGRYGARLWLHRQRRRGRCVHRVVVVGPAEQALEMTTRLQRDPLTGLVVVGACVVDNPETFEVASSVPVMGTLDDVLPVLDKLGADTVVVAKGSSITPEDLRLLSYELEGTGVELLMSPLLTNVAGSRITQRAIPGVALVHVDEAELVGSRRLVKEVFDRVVALTGLVLLALPFILLALVVKLSSPGPVFFRQERIGQDGRPFRIWKFRTMYADAEQRKSDLTHLSRSTLYFKVQNDPRITPVGRFLRKYSLDELPQLFNVMTGDMSLVGPRPQVQSEVDAYDVHLHRRLLVKPGMTGLWQVSGRNDLAVEEAVSLDLHYVENWSLGLDVAVLCRTLLAVLRPTGAS